MKTGSHRGSQPEFFDLLVAVLEFDMQELLVRVVDVVPHGVAPPCRFDAESGSSQAKLGSISLSIVSISAESGSISAESGTISLSLNRIRLNFLVDRRFGIRLNFPVNRLILALI